MCKKSIQIIIADGNDRVRESLRELLETYADIHVIGEAATAEDALRLCEKFTPDVLLLDLYLPDMDGLTATRTIKTRVPEVNIIVFDNILSPEVEILAREAGAWDYVHKLEITGGQIYDSITRALRATAARQRVPQARASSARPKPDPDTPPRPSLP